MAAKISLYPTLNDELMSKIRFQTSAYEFYYKADDNEFPLNPEEVNNNPCDVKILDKKGIWTPDDYNFCIRRKYFVRTYQCLFGRDGIACRNAIIGVALRWASSDSKQRGVIKIGVLHNSAKDEEFKLDYEFPAAQLRGVVELTTVLYLEKPGTPLWDEKHLANNYGCILGELDRITARLDGTGSEFPVFYTDKPLLPLWYIQCEWDDPTIDQFSECISIFINRSNKNYKFLEKDEHLLREIMASALFLLISKLKAQEEYWADTVAGNNLTEGSVSAAVHYFINTLGWDPSTPESLSVSIRKFFEQRM